MKVLVADKFEQEGLDALAALGCEVSSDPGLQDGALESAIADLGPEVLVVRSTRVGGAAIGASAGLRLIVRAGSGVDNIDLDAASAAGVAVCNCPGMNAIAVAELAMGLLLCCDRRLPDQAADLREGRWRKKEYGQARGLKGLTLGVVGVGFIGEALIPRAKAFGMRVTAWSRSLTPERATSLGAEFGGSTREQLLEMLPACDAVSLHVALSEGTRGMCDGEFFDAMKPGAYLINTARGGVVNGAALHAAVSAKGIRCGLDVFTEQPTPNDTEFGDGIVELPGVYGTHHCGASTEQAQLAVAEETVRIVSVYKSTGRFENRVNGAAVAPVVRSPAQQSERVTR